MQVMSVEDAGVRTVAMGGDIGSQKVHDYFGRIHNVLPGPQAYLVEHLDGGSSIYPHFHDVDQFQVFMGGDGSIGKHEACAVTAHYADGYSPYGPIFARKAGLAYFTLRLAAASGGWRMPGNRHLMPGRAGRTFSVRFEDHADPAPRGEVIRRSLWGPAEDGLEVIGMRLGPDASANGVAPAGGQYVIVCSGALSREGRQLGANSLLFFAAGEAAPVFAAGPEGAALLVMQYPRPSARPGSDPAAQTGKPSAYALRNEK